MRYLVGFMCVLALGVAAHGCGGEGESCGTPGPGWFLQCTPTGAYLFAVSFVDADTGTVVGGSGTILRTTDGGATWVEQDSGTTNGLHGVSFTDANIGTAVGQGGIILRTMDGGATWIAQDSRTDHNLQDVSFARGEVGTAVGDAERKWTIDGTGSWAWVYVPTVVWTLDGGATWWSLVSGAGDDDLLGVSFTDANTGTAVGRNGTILRTTDGGATWVAQESGAQYGEDLFDVWFTDANIGTAVGLYGIILRTTDGGATWVRQPGPTPQDFLLGVSFADSNNGIVVGMYEGGPRGLVDRGVIFRTKDGGATWVRQESGTTNGLSGVSFTDANTGTAVGQAGTILRTTDGGGGVFLCEGLVCDDGDWCTDDTCDPATGECHFRTVVECDDGDWCTDDTCDPATGECHFTIVEDGTGCFPQADGIGMCEAGACVAACDPASTEEYQCPFEGASARLLCCPGREYCIGPTC
jgi:photosystem II stability/assembly factor-like uncharacterized protein